MATTASLITKQPGRCGGDACVRDTRITVWGLVEWRQLGRSDEWIRNSVEGLCQADLDGAWQYYAMHQEEIDEAIRQNVEG